MQKRVRAAVATAMGVPEGAAVPVGADGGAWSGAWATAAQRPNEIVAPEWSAEGFADQTVRQIVRITSGGEALRVRVSNVCGSTPLRVAGATIARSGGGAEVDPASIRPLTFGQREEFAIPPRAELATDPVPMPTEPLEHLTITLYFAEPTGPAQFHGQANVTNHRAPGDHRADAGGAAFTETADSWFYLAGVDVTAPPDPSSVVAFGDSITDGAGSSLDAHRSYPDVLADRLVKEGTPRGVLNAGISGNRVLSGSPCFGDSAAQRFQRDVLDQPGVSTVIVLEGINDIGANAQPPFAYFEPNPEVTARKLIDAHRELVTRAHARGITVVGGTLLPYKGAGYYSDRGEAIRQQVNEWIRESGEYDAVVDFDRAVADPADPLRLAPAYDSGDNLHLSDDGYRAMADAINLADL